MKTPKLSELKWTDFKSDADFVKAAIDVLIANMKDEYENAYYMGYDVGLAEGFNKGWHKAIKKFNIDTTKNLVNEL